MGHFHLEKRHRIVKLKNQKQVLINLNRKSPIKFQSLFIALDSNRTLLKSYPTQSLLPVLHLRITGTTSHTG